MKWSRQQKIIFVSASLAFLILCLIWFFFNRQVELRQEEKSWAYHARDIDDRLVSLLSTLKDAETGERGYLLTGNPVDLEPYALAIKVLPQDVALLQLLVDNDPQQRQDATALAHTTQRKLEEMHRTIALYKAGRVKEAAAIIKSDEERLTMGSIRQEIAKMRAFEQRRFEQHDRDLTALDRKVYRASIFGGLGSLATLTFVLLLFGRQVNQRIASEEKLRENEERLRTITDNVPALIGYFDRQERFRFNNATYQEWYGSEMGSLYGRSVRETIGEQAYAVAEPLIRLALSGEQVTFECTQSDKSGLRHLQVTYIPHFAAHRDVVGAYVLAHDITERKKTEEQLAYLAQYDALTNLPNRRLLYDRLLQAISRCRRKGTLACLMYLDIDHFKHINDNMGHDTGDAVLKAFAGRLRGCLRDVDTIARIGGDEFIIILEELLEEENAMAVARKIVTTMQPIFSLGEHTLHLSTSVGVAFFNGQETDVDHLIKQADTALYQAKAAGRNRFEVARAPVA